MIKSTDISRVIEAVKLDDQTKWDETVPVENIRMMVDGRLYVRGMPSGREWQPLNNKAFDQLMTRIGIPTAYARRCPPELLFNHVNHWLEEHVDTYKRQKGKDPVWLLRGREDYVRAVLTEDYSILDNHHIIGALKDVLPDLNLQVERFHIDEDSFHLRLVDPGKKRDFGSLRTGERDRLFGGVHVQNCETGGRSTRAEFFIYRLVCANGLVGVDRDSMFSQVHRGFGTQQRFLERFVDSMKDIDRRIERQFGLLEESQKELTHNAADLIEYIGKQNLLSEEKIESVKKALENPHSGLHSRYNIINAFTAGARDYTGDTRYEVEAIGGWLTTRSIVQLELDMLKEKELELAKQKKDNPA